MKIITLVLVIIILNSLLNISRCASTIRYYNKFKSHNIKTNECSAAVERLFDKAGTNRILNVTRWQGEKLSQCLDIDSARTLLDRAFQQTIGVYKFRSINSFNLLYWVETPSRFLKLHGIKVPTIVDTLIKAFFACLTFLAGYIAEKILDAGLFDKIVQVCQSILK